MVVSGLGLLPTPMQARIRVVQSLVVAVPFQHFYLVAIRVLDEEEAREQFVAALEFLHRAELVALGRQRRVGSGRIGDDDASMSIAGPVCIGFDPTLDSHQFDLAVILRITRAHRREIGTVEGLQTQRPHGSPSQ